MEQIRDKAGQCCQMFQTDDQGEQDAVLSVEQQLKDLYAAHNEQMQRVQDEFEEVQRPPYQADKFNSIRTKLLQLNEVNIKKSVAWEQELRDLQDKNQLKQFKIDKFEQHLTTERVEKQACQAELRKY